jgi:hypothetical protein
MACYERTQGMGMQSNCAPVIVGPQSGGVVYNNDRQGFSVEMMFLSRKYFGLYGFARPRLLDRALNFMAEMKARAVYRGTRGS